MKPITVFSLTIRTGRNHRSHRKLHVVLWRHLKDLRAAAKKSSHRSAYYWKHAAGAYCGIQVYRNGRLRQFGEIHLWEKLMGAGYFTHELQHFMIDYSEGTESYPLDPEASERMSFLAGDLAAQFWTKFYERFDCNK